MTEVQLQLGGVDYLHFITLGRRCFDESTSHAVAVFVQATLTTAVRVAVEDVGSPVLSGPALDNLRAIDACLKC